MIASLAVGGVCWIVLNWSHCRNPGLATMAAGMLAVLLYFGYYQLGLISIVGVGNAHRVDLLPSYVQFRMANDVARNVHHAKVPNALPRWPDVVQRGSIGFFSAEFLAVTAVLVGIGRSYRLEGVLRVVRTLDETRVAEAAARCRRAVWDSLQRGDHAAARQDLTDTSRQGAVSGTPHARTLPACPAERSAQPRVPDREGYSRPGTSRPGRGQDRLRVQAQAFRGCGPSWTRSR